MAEKVRSGWSNLLLLAQRKNVVKGSYMDSKLDIAQIKDRHPHLKSQLRVRPRSAYLDCNHHNQHNDNRSAVLNLVDNR